MQEIGRVVVLLLLVFGMLVSFLLAFSRNHLVFLVVRYLIPVVVLLLVFVVLVMHLLC